MAWSMQREIGLVIPRGVCPLQTSGSHDPSVPLAQRPVSSEQPAMRHGRLRRAGPATISSGTNSQKVEGVSLFLPTVCAVHSSVQYAGGCVRLR